MLQNIETNRIKELIIDRKEPLDDNERDFINDVIKKSKNWEHPTNKDIEYYDTLIFISNRNDLIYGGKKPKNEEEQKIIDDYYKFLKESEEADERYYKNKEALEKELEILIKKYIKKDLKLFELNFNKNRKIALATSLGNEILYIKKMKKIYKKKFKIDFESFEKEVEELHNKYDIHSSCVPFWLEELIMIVNEEDEDEID